MRRVDMVVIPAKGTLVKRLVFLTSEAGELQEVRLRWVLPEEEGGLLEWVIHADTWACITSAIERLGLRLEGAHQLSLLEPQPARLEA